MQQDKLQFPMEVPIISLKGDGEVHALDEIFAASTAKASIHFDMAVVRNLSCCEACNYVLHVRRLIVFSDGFGLLGGGEGGGEAVFLNMKHVHTWLCAASHWH